MQEIKKTRIVLASILKPVNDTRMYEKMAVSLAYTGLYDVHIIGYTANERPKENEIITVHGLPPFKRLSVKRSLASWNVFRNVYQLKPSVLIITTHELLLPALLLKVVTGCVLVYDVRENYFRNILHTTAFPKLIRPWIAAYVRSAEFLCAPFIDHFLLAEKAYAQELKFIRKRKKTIVENKLRFPTENIISKQKQPRTGINLLFSGTLAESTGVFLAIKLATALHAFDSTVRLTIIGHAAQPEVQQRLREEVRHKTFIQLIGINVLVPHSQILSEIQSAHAGIIAYPPNPSTSNAIPTKLYEYLGFQLPILLIDNQPWVDLCAPCHAAVTFNPAHIEPELILYALKHEAFYTQLPQNINWVSEEKKFLSVIESLL